MKRNSVLFVVLLFSMLTLPAMGAGRKDIAPLLTTQWGNGMPFSNDCWVRWVRDVPPTHIDTVYVFQNPTWGVSSYAQLMRFHEIAGTENWLSMKDVYEKTDQDAEALATLYGDITRKTWLKYNTLENLSLLNFKQETLREWSMTDFDLNEWENLVYQELAEGRPVLISSSGSYCICDGYKDGLFHFNCGNYGEGDGYSSLTCRTVFGPNRQLPVWHQGALNMRAYTGIQPVDGTGLAQEHLVATIGECRADKQSFLLKNGQNPEVRFDYGMWIKGEQLDTVMMSEIGKQVSEAWLNCQLADSVSAPGRYLIWPAYRETGQTLWHKTQPCVEVVKNADGTSTIQPYKGTTDDLEVESLTLKGNMTEGCPQEVELVVFNKGGDFRSEMYFKSDSCVFGGEKGTFYNYYTLKAGTRDTLHFVYYLPSGNHEVWARIGGSGGFELFRQELTIKKLDDEWRFEPLWTLNECNDQHVLTAGCKVEGELQLKNLEHEVYYNKLQIVWQRETNGEYNEMAELSRDYFAVQSGETLTFPFSFIQMPKEGEKYRIVLQGALDWVTTKDLASYEFEVNGTTGIRQAMASEADDVWYTLQGVRLNAKPSQRGIYIKNGRKVTM